VSNILDIYEDISKMTVGDVKCRNIDKISLTIRDGSLPMRLLLPSTSGDMDFIALGDMQGVAWTIRDLCLFAPVTKGKGIEQFSEAMVEYLSLYMAAVKANRNPTTTSNIVGVEGTMKPIQWAEKTYWAVDVTLTVSEVI